MTRKPTAVLAGLMLVAVALSLAPGATAHDCYGNDCGPCIPGQDHEHVRENSACRTRELVSPPPLPPLVQDLVDLILGE